MDEQKTWYIHAYLCNGIQKAEVHVSTKMNLKILVLSENNQVTEECHLGVGGGGCVSIHKSRQTKQYFID